MTLENSILATDQSWWALLFALLVGHAVADYPLQGEFLAKGKNHRLPPDFGPELGTTKALWLHCLTFHAVIHAGAVWLITGSVVFGMIELAAHWVLDFVKSEGWTNFHVDQLLHVLCKVAYVVAIFGAWPGPG